MCRSGVAMVRFNYVTRMEGVRGSTRPREDRNSDRCLHENQRNNPQSSVTELMKVWRAQTETTQVRRVPRQGIEVAWNRLDSQGNARGQTGEQAA